MKSVSGALQTHFGLDCTTLALLWKVSRTDGVILGFTNHDQDITYSGVTYAAATGFTPSAVESAADLSTDNLEVTAFFDSAAIKEVDIRAGLYNFADVEVRIVNYADLTMGDLKLRKGTLGVVTAKNGIFTAEIRGLTYRFSMYVGMTYGRVCRADLGDARCQVDLSMLAQTGSVASSADARTFVPTAGLIGATGYFNDGVLTWTSGLNNTFPMEVKIWDGTTITLFESMPYPIVAGDTFTVEPGCDHSTSDCETKFAGVHLLDGSITPTPGGNIKNFQGEPFIPGMDAMLDTPSASN